jgi:hypothetical protein
MRESVEVMRAERNARTADLTHVLTASLCFPARLYDPASIQVDSVTELQALMERSNREHIPLMINFADKAFLKLRDPAMAALLEDETRFKAFPSFPGIHGQRERWVYEYLGKVGNL